jgi:hypothetical protein
VTIFAGPKAEEARAGLFRRAEIRAHQNRSGRRDGTLRTALLHRIGTLASWLMYREDAGRYSAGH